jgi:protein-disulfide isomerase
MPKLRLSLCAILAALVLGTAPAAAQMTPEQRGEVEQVVRDYLLANPEIIEEAYGALQEKRKQEASLSQGQAIGESAEKIFNSPHQVVLGNPQGPITLVEFFDYNCGYCKRAVADMTALIAANPDVRVVIKEFPILSQSSFDAARVSVAVKDEAPERYLDFHQALFSRPGEATGEKALDVAREIGLDSDALKARAAGNGVMGNLQEVHELATRLGISGTPAYVIGKEVIPGAVGFDTLQEKVTAMRECGETSC